MQIIMQFQSVQLKIIKLMIINVFIVANDTSNTYKVFKQYNCDGIQQFVNNSCQLPTGQQIKCNT